MWNYNLPVVMRVEQLLDHAFAVVMRVEQQLEQDICFFMVNQTLPVIMRVKQQLEHGLCASGNHASPAV